MRSLRRRLRGRGAVVGAAGGRRGVGMAWRGPCAGRVGRGRGRGHVDAAVLAAVVVVLCLLDGVAEDLMSSLDLLESCDDFLLAARVAVWVVLQGEGAESLADLVLAGGGCHAQVGVVVARGISLCHGGGGGGGGGGG